MSRVSLGWLLAAAVACAAPVPPAGEPTSPPPSDDPDDWPGPGPTCGLTAGEPVFVLEGSSFEAELRCGGELPLSEFDLFPLRLPPGAAWDGGWLRWTPGGRDAGRHEAVFSARPRDLPDAVPSAETVPIEVVDVPGLPGGLAPDPRRYRAEWDVPVLHVATGRSVGESYVAADLTWEGRDYAAQIKVRGASSTAYPKPSYALEFNEEELPIEAWGVTRDHLYLVSTFDDNSYVRQKLMYDQWAAIAAYWDAPRLTPRTFFVVLYLDGQYMGLYTAVDRPDNEFADHMGFARAGNIYKSVNHDANYYAHRASGSPKATWHDGYRKKEGPEGDFSDLDALVEWTANAPAGEIVALADRWFDLREFMDWFLLVHFAEAGDSAGKNVYLHNDPNLPRFHLTPWDFNHAWGQGWYTFRIQSDTLHAFDGHNRIFWAIQSVPPAEEEVWDRFAAMREDGPYALDWMLDRLDGYYAQIDRSAARDWARWGAAYRGFGRWRDTREGAGDWTDYEGEKRYVYDWIAARAALFEELHPDAP